MVEYTVQSIERLIEDERKSCRSDSRRSKRDKETKEMVDRGRWVAKRTYTADGSAESTCAVISCRLFKSRYQSDIDLRVINVRFVMASTLLYFAWLGRLLM